MVDVARSLLWTVPAIFALTVGMGTLSLLASVLDGTGRLQHRIARRWARLVLSVSGVQVTITGAEKLLRQTSYVFCSNHLSLIDTPLVFGFLPWEFRVLARSGLWSIPFLGWHLRRAGHMPVDRGDVRASARSLVNASRRVAQGTSVLVFPEGGRSKDGRLGEFKAGVAHIALRARVPVVPLAILGTRAIHREGSPILRPGQVELRIGTPIITTSWSSRDSRGLIRELQRRVAELMD